jgi:DNA-binding NarL/FixJ family response regulator
MSGIRVLIVDDQTVVREGLTLLVGLIDGVEVVGSTADGEEAVALAAAVRPDVVLMDLRMPVVDGVEATRRIRAALPDTQVLVLTTYADDASLFPALQAGARGYLTKDASAQEIEQAVRALAAGRTHLAPEVQERLLGAVVEGQPPVAAPQAAIPQAAIPQAAIPQTAIPQAAIPQAAIPQTAIPQAAIRQTAIPQAAIRQTATLPEDLTPREAEVLGLIAAGLSNAEIADRLVVSHATVKTHVNRIFYKTGVRDRAQAVRFAYEHGLAQEDR